MRILGLLAGLLLINVSCTLSDSSSEVSIDLSKYKSFSGKSVNAQSTPYANGIELAILNITGPGVNPPIFKHQECKDNPSCLVFAADVPAGKELLIQALVVKDGSTNVLEFFYGEAKPTLKAGNQVVDLSMGSAGASSMEGRFAGRYIPSYGSFSGKKLSGNVDVLFQPSTGSSPMKVMEFEMFGGWFQAMLLQNIDFVFHFKGWDESSVEHNGFLFGEYGGGAGKINLDTFSPATDNQKLVHVEANDYWEIHQENGSPVTKKEDAKRMIFGLFGQQPVGDTPDICWDSSQDITFDGNNQTEELCTTDTTSCGTYVSWTSSAYPISNTFPISTSLDITAGAHNCSNNGSGDNTDLFSTEWKINRKEFSHDTSDMANFAGPFQAFAAGDGLDMFSSTGSVTKWKTLPSSNVYGFDVYLRNGHIDEDDVRDNEDGIDCNKLSSLGFSYQEHVLPGANQSSHSFNPRTQMAVVCPKKPDGNYYRSAALLFDRHHQPLPTKIAMSQLYHGGQAYINQGACVPFKIELQDDSSNPASAFQDIAVSLASSNSTSGAFYSDSQCSLSISAVSLSMQKVVFFKHNLSTESTSLSASAAGLTSATLNRNYVSNPANDVTHFPAFYRKQSLEQAEDEICVEQVVAVRDSNDELVAAAGTSSISSFGPTGSSGTYQVFASKTDCEMGSPTISGTHSLTPGITLHSVWLRNSTATPVAEMVNSFLNGTCMANGTGVSCSSQGISIVASGPYDHFHADVEDTNPNANDCVPIYLSGYDNHQPNSYPADWPHAGSISLHSEGVSGDFYPTNACSTSITSFLVTVATPGGYVYFKPSSSGESGDLVFEYSATGEQSRTSIQVQ